MYGSLYRLAIYLNKLILGVINKKYSIAGESSTLEKSSLLCQILYILLLYLLYSNIFIFYAITLFLEKCLCVQDYNSALPIYNSVLFFIHFLISSVVLRNLVLFLFPYRHLRIPLILPIKITLLRSLSLNGKI